MPSSIKNYSKTDAGKGMEMKNNETFFLFVKNSSHGQQKKHHKK